VNTFELRLRSWFRLKSIIIPVVEWALTVNGRLINANLDASVKVTLAPSTSTVTLFTNSLIVVYVPECSVMFVSNDAFVVVSPSMFIVVEGTV